MLRKGNDFKFQRPAQQWLIADNSEYNLIQEMPKKQIFSWTKESEVWGASHVQGGAKFDSRFREERIDIPVKRPSSSVPQDACFAFRGNVWV